MIQIAICPRKPYDLSSFLRPLIAEMNQLYSRGLIIKKGDEVRYDGNAAILGFTGDIPDIAQVINFVGHTGTYGCRICLVVADLHTEHVRHGQYFSTEAAERTMESLLQGDEVSNLSILFRRHINLLLQTGSWYGRYPSTDW